MPFNGTDNILFVGQTTNGNSAIVQWFGGRGAFFAQGTFGGGTIALQFRPQNDTTWFNVDRSGDTFVTFTANGAGQFDLPVGHVRAVLSGATSPSVSARVEEIFT